MIPVLQRTGVCAVSVPVRLTAPRCMVAGRSSAVSGSLVGAEALSVSFGVRGFSTSVASSKFDIDADPFDPLKKRPDHAYTRTSAKYMPGFSFPAPRSLESIVKYALLERETADQIEMIWTKFHEDRSDSVADTIRPSEWAGFQDRARRYPNMVYPVLKGDGNFFVLFAQWQGKHCIMTFLEDYKRNPMVAEPYLSLTFFDDLLDRKGVVLLRGDFSYHLTKLEAQKLLTQVQHHYLQDPSLVEQFNTQPEKFDFNKLLSMKYD